MKNLFLIFFLWISVSSFADFSDSVSVKKTDSDTTSLKTWHINEYGEILHLIPDTLLPDFHLYNVLDREYRSYASLGNLGLAVKPNIFYQQDNTDNFIFYSPFNLYGSDASENIFFNTRKRYTHVTYTGGNQQMSREQTLQVVHAQNINPYLNVGLRYNTISSIGQYKNQTSKVNTVNLFSSYIKNRIRMHAAGNFNKFKMQENGGIKYDSVFESNLLRSMAIPVFFDGNVPKSVLRNINTNLNFSYTFGDKEQYFVNDTIERFIIHEKFRIGFSSDYEQSFRIYEDNKPLSGFYHGVYVDELSPLNYDSSVIAEMDSTGSNYIDSRVPIFIDSTLTFDSVFAATLINQIYFSKPADTSAIFSFGYNIKAGSEFTNNGLMQFWQQEQQGANIIARGYDKVNLHSIFVGGEVYQNTNPGINWNVGAKYFPSGYRKGDINLRGGITKNFAKRKNRSLLSLNLDFSRVSPFFFEQHYFSNHYKWDSTFVKKDKTVISLIYNVPKWNLSAGIYYHILDNYIYFDRTGYPRQETSTFEVRDFVLSKKFNLWKLVSDNYIVYQDIGNKGIIRAPDLIVYSSTYLHHVFNFKLTEGKLTTQLGVNILYNSSYSPYTYLPAINQFVPQDNKEINGHPYMDFFLSFKLKRARFYLKYAHFNTFFMDPDYYTVYPYPMSGRALKFGISWGFYD